MTIKISNGKITGELITPGWEASTIGATAPVDLNGDGGSIGWDAPMELGFTSVFVYSVYSATLTALQLEPFVRSGHISRREQAGAMWSAAGDSIKNNWLKFVAVTIVVSLLPGLGPVVGVASLFGSVFIANKIVRAFWAALTPEQQNNLRDAAKGAGVPMPESTEEHPERGSAAGYDEHDPLPTPA